MAYGLIGSILTGAAQGVGDLADKDLAEQRKQETFQRELEMKQIFLDSVEKAKREQARGVAGEIQAARDKELGAAGASQISKGLGQMSPEAEANTAQALAQYPEARAAYAKTLGGGADLSGGLISAKPIDELKAKEAIAARIGAPEEADAFRKRIETEQAGVKDANLAKHYEDTLSETIRSNKANEANNRAGAGLRAIQTDLAKLQLEHAQQEAKIPAAVNKQLDSFNKEIDILRSAASKSDFDPSTPNGIKVIGDLDKLREGYGKLISPYLPQQPEKSKPSADDLAKINSVINGTQQPQTGAKTVSTGEQKIADGLIVRAPKYSNDQAGAAQSKLDEAQQKSSEAGRQDARRAASQFILKASKGIGDAGAAQVALDAENRYPGTLTAQQKKQALSLTQGK